ILAELQPRANFERKLTNAPAQPISQNLLPLADQQVHLAANAIAVPSAAPQTKRTGAPAPNSPTWDAIGYDPVTEEQLQRRTGLAPAQLQVELFTLELEGHIERRGHGQFVRTLARSVS
ncbi:MAG: hypothetical protein WCG12_10510, partial [Alcaligenaceae bacterium]